MILCDKYLKDLTGNGWLVPCIICYKSKERKRGIIKMCHLFRKYNCNNHYLCYQHLNSVANLITEEETRGKQNQNRKSQRGVTNLFVKRSDKKPKQPTNPTPPTLPYWGCDASLTVAARYVVVCVWYYINYMFTFAFILKAYYM